MRYTGYRRTRRERGSIKLHLYESDTTFDGISHSTISTEGHDPSMHSRERGRSPNPEPVIATRSHTTNDVSPNQQVMRKLNHEIPSAISAQNHRIVVTHPPPPWPWPQKAQAFKFQRYCDIMDLTLSAIPSTPCNGTEYRGKKI